MPLTLYRHSSLILAGIHHNQRPKTWIPACHAVVSRRRAKTFTGMTLNSVCLL